MLSADSEAASVGEWVPAPHSEAAQLRPAYFAFGVTLLDDSAVDIFEGGKGADRFFAHQQNTSAYKDRFSDFESDDVVDTV